MMNQTMPVTRTAAAAPTPGAASSPYQAREFDLAAVTGLSQRATALHLDLYRGYVKAVNELLEEQGAAFPAAGKAVVPLDLASHTRRFAFEYNGMVLHELFFEALGAPGATAPDPRGALAEAAKRSFGSLERWTKHAAELAQLRGVGWIVCVRDPATHRLYNAWVDLHHLMLPANTQVVLALDLWEHAYLLDFTPAQRADYFRMIWSCIDWHKVEERCRR